VHGSIYSTQGIETDVYARLPNIILASCDLIIDFLTLRSTVSALAPICIENGSFHSFSLEVGNRRMNGQTEWTKEQVENIMPKTSIYCCTDKNSMCLLTVLSAIAKFLVQLLGESEGRNKMGEGRGRGRV